MTLAGLAECEIVSEADKNKCAVTPVVLKDISIDVVIPLEGLVDFEEEIKRLEKNIDKLSKEESQISKRLSNDNFVKNAPDEVVEEAKQQQASLQQQIESLKSSLLRLK